MTPAFRNAWPPRHPTTPPCRARAATQVLGEDLVLVQGQQDRMARGADVWGNPVSYDKLGVRYRRWRNSGARPALPASWLPGCLAAVCRPAGRHVRRTQPACRQRAEAEVPGVTG